MRSSTFNAASHFRALCAGLLLAAAFASNANAGAPTISGTPQVTGTIGQNYQFTPVASDPDGDRLNFLIKNRPSWLNFSYGTGGISGTPTSAGTWTNIQIFVRDSGALASLPPFSITVSASTNHAPTISGSPGTAVTAGSAYSFRPTAADVDNNTLGFAIQNRPSWATFSTTTGQLSGTPAASDAGAFANIVIAVSDGKVSTALRAFAITVSGASNNVPQISGTPVAALDANSAYSFLPTASDADGDTLTFAIANKPSWAAFSTTTGQLSGTPGGTSTGAYANIVISTSDGKSTASLPAFGITVNQVSLGSAALSWMPPTQNTDGTVLTNLAGYRIYYGTSATALNQTLAVAGAGISAAVIEDLQPATYYFAVRAYTSTGVESQNSNVASKIVQ